MTIYNAIASTQFKNKHVLEMLLCHHLGLSGKDDIIRNYDKEIAEDIFEKITKDYQDHTDKHIPLEYILGYVTFFGRSFTVSNQTLIPRPETEYMIQAVIDRSHRQKASKNEILYDIGTGCGILGTSCFLECVDRFSSVFCTDISQSALDVAKKNATTHTAHDLTRFRFFTSDLCSFLEDMALPIHTDDIHHCFVANLPYIPDATFAQDADMSAQLREPRIAFVGGDDGLDLYRTFLNQIHRFACQTRQDGKNRPVIGFLEMMTRQIDILEKEFGHQRHFNPVKTFHSNIRIVESTLI